MLSSGYCPDHAEAAPCQGDRPSPWGSTTCSRARLRKWRGRRIQPSCPGSDLPQASIDLDVRTVHKAGCVGREERDSVVIVSFGAASITAAASGVSTGPRGNHVHPDAAILQLDGPAARQCPVPAHGMPLRAARPAAARGHVLGSGRSGPEAGQCFVRWTGHRLASRPGTAACRCRGSQHPRFRRTSGKRPGPAAAGPRRRRGRAGRRRGGTGPPPARRRGPGRRAPPRPRGPPRPGDCAG